MNNCSVVVEIDTQGVTTEPCCQDVVGELESALCDQILRGLRENYVPLEAPAYATAIQAAKEFESLFVDEGTRLQALDRLSQTAAGYDGLERPDFDDVELMRLDSAPMSRYHALLAKSGQVGAAPVFCKERQSGHAIFFPKGASGEKKKSFILTSPLGVAEDPKNHIFDWLFYRPHNTIPDEIGDDRWRSIMAEYLRGVFLLHELAHSSYDVGSKYSQKLRAADSHGDIHNEYLCLLDVEFHLLSELNSWRMDVGFGKQHIVKAGWAYEGGVGERLKKEYLDKWTQGWREDMSEIEQKLEQSQSRDESLEAGLNEYHNAIKFAETKILPRLRRASKAMTEFELHFHSHENQETIEKCLTKLLYAAGPTVNDIEDADKIKNIYESPAGSRPLSPLEYIEAAVRLIKQGYLTIEDIETATTGENLNKNYAGVEARSVCKT